MKEERIERLEKAVMFIANYAVDYDRNEKYVKVHEILNPPNPKEFLECDTCRSKAGSPTLCAGCLHNRSLIEKLSKK